MISSASQFIEFTNAHDPELRRKSRFGPLANHVWEEVLARHPDYIEAAVLNKNVPTEFLDRLVRHDRDAVRETVAMKRKISAWAMAILAEDESTAVRLTLVRNPRLMDEILEKLTRDRDPYIAQIAVERLQQRKPN